MKRVTSSPRDVSLPSENSNPASSVHSSSSGPGPLLCCSSPFSTTGVHTGIHSLPACCCHTLPPHAASGLPTRSVSGPTWRHPTSGPSYGCRGQSKHPVYTTNSPFVPVENSFQIVLRMSSRGKTMCIYPVTCTTLTKASEPTVAATMCHTQMPTGKHRLEINLAFMTL